MFVFTLLLLVGKLNLASHQMGGQTNLRAIKCVLTATCCDMLLSLAETAAAAQYHHHQHHCDKVAVSKVSQAEEES